MSRVNLTSGNMYQWCRAYNPWSGECLHACTYCYAKHHRFPVLRRKYSGLMRVGKMDANLYHGGVDKVLFVGSMTDAWAEGVPDDVIMPVLEYCSSFPENTYLFQSKNPGRFLEFKGLFPPKTILGTTIESNWAGEYSQAPDPVERMVAMSNLHGFTKMVSIEPVMLFDPAVMTMWIRLMDTAFVVIGADSKSNSLPEPTANSINQLIMSCRRLTVVKVKENLRRLGIAESLIGGC